MSNTKTTPGAPLTAQLTPHQLCVAVFIHAYQAKNDNMPSHAEVAAAFGIACNAAFEAVQRLTKHGVFEKTENFSKYRFSNYCEVGTLRINGEGYIDIKMADGFHQWFLLARYNWFLHTGHWTTSQECIWYKNGDKHDCDPSNLEIITRREHLSRTKQQTNLQNQGAAA